jgi:hypothetical protein
MGSTWEVPKRTMYLTASGHREALISVLERQHTGQEYEWWGGVYARLRQAEVVQPSDGVRSDADPGQCPGESGPRSEAGAHRPRPNQIIACGDQLPR